MAKGNAVGQSTAAVSSTHAAKLTSYNQAGKTGLGGLRLCDGYFPPLHIAELDISAHPSWDGWYTLPKHTTTQVDTPCTIIILLRLAMHVVAWTGRVMLEMEAQ